LYRKCGTHGEKRNACRLLVGKPQGKGLLGRTRHRWKGNNRKDLSEIGRNRKGWVNLVEDMDKWRALVNTVMKLWVIY
jgi:hypothetical protein